MAEMGNKSSVRMTFVFQAQEKIAHIFFFGEAGTLFLILSPSSYLLLAGAIKELADRRGHPYKRIGSAIST